MSVNVPRAVVKITWHNTVSNDANFCLPSSESSERTTCFCSFTTTENCVETGSWHSHSKDKVIQSKTHGNYYLLLNLVITVTGWSLLYHIMASDGYGWYVTKILTEFHNWKKVKSLNSVFPEVVRLCSPLSLCNSAWWWFMADWASWLNHWGERQLALPRLSPLYTPVAWQPARCYVAVCQLNCSIALCPSLSCCIVAMNCKVFCAEQCFYSKEDPCAADTVFQPTLALFPPERNIQSIYTESMVGSKRGGWGVTLLYKVNDWSKWQISTSCWHSH